LNIDAAVLERSGRQRCFLPRRIRRRSSCDEPVPGVVFKLQNNGERALNKVQVTVFFRDAVIVIAEGNYPPVYVGEYWIDRDVKPPKVKQV
jgi:hypothetical protein